MIAFRTNINRGHAFWHGLCIIIGLFVAFITLIFSHNHDVYASTIDDSVFEEFYECQKIKSDRFDLCRLRVIDEENHLYIEDCIKFHKKDSAVGVFSSPFEQPDANYSGIAFSGVLKSNTAKIVEIQSWSHSYDRMGEEDIDRTCAYCMPGDLNWGIYNGEDPDNSANYAYKKTEGNVFNTVLSEKRIGGSAVALRSDYGCDFYSVIVEDKGIRTECIILRGIAGLNYEYYDEQGHWTGNEYGKNIDYVINLFDGTDGGCIELDEQYQYGKEISWKKGQYINAIDDNGSYNRNNIELPAEVKSIRLSYDVNIPGPTDAISLDIPDKNLTEHSDDGRKKRLNYSFYRSKYRAVSINNGELYKIHEGEASPELPLKRGLNIIYLYGDDRNDRYNSLSDKAVQADNFALLIYWDGDDSYPVQQSSNASLQYLDIFRGASSCQVGEGGYDHQRIDNPDPNHNGEYHVSVETAYPFLWVNPVTKDPGAFVEIEGSTAFLGGYFVSLEDEQEKFTVKTRSEDASNNRAIDIYLDWKSTGAVLKSFNVTKGGQLGTPFSPGTYYYYIGTEENEDKITVNFSLPEGIMAKVYLDQKLNSRLSGTDPKILRVSSLIKEMVFELQSNDGLIKKYTFDLTRRNDRVSDESKIRAKRMIDKMISGGYLDYIKTENASYWTVFGAASLGQDYMEGMLAENITKHSIKQATDAAAIIMQLVIIGEDPYDYLGVNYVEKLMTFSDEGNFGGFGNNIWALYALQVAGADIPQKTINIVLQQAANETFDLDMRGWAMSAASTFKNQYSDQKYASLIRSIKNVEIREATTMNGVDVTGCFENFYYTNRNSMSHGCVISGLVSMGVDPGGTEFQGTNGSDPISVLENYQLTNNGGWIVTPEDIDISSDGYNKDVVIAVGDIYNGSNVYTRYYLTEDRYRELLRKAEGYLSVEVEDADKKDAFVQAYDNACAYAGSGSGISSHGKEFYALQEALFDVDPTLKPDVFMGTKEEKEKVAEVNSAIQEISSYSYSDLDKIDRIKKQYEDLKEERLFRYVVGLDILDKAYNYIRDIDDFIEAVDKIGTVNLTKTSKIKKARKAYDALSDRQKEEDVVNEAYKTLQEAEAAIIKMNDPDKVERAIRNLGSIVTLDLQDDIEAVREAYDSLSDADKAKVTNVEDLEKAEEKLRNLLARETAIDNAAAVTEKIASIGDVSRNSEDAIRQAREAYDALETEEEKNLVSNYRILLDSETEYANLLDREELGNALSEADYHINQIYQAFGDSDQLGEDNCQDVSEAVEEAGRFFEQKEEKWPDFCQMVSGYPSYVDIRTMIAEYTFDPDLDASLDNLEGILDSIGDVTLDREPDVRKAEMILETLRASDGTSDDLGAYETRISSLREEITAIRDSYPDICSLVTAIESVGEVSQTYQDAYLEAANLYNNAEEALTSRIPATAIETITEAGNKYGELREEIEEISRIEGQIEETRQASSLLDEEAVVSARDAYEGSGRKESISNYLTLLEAEKKIVSLKKAAEDAQIAAEVEDMIGLLNSSAEINPVDVALARVAYDALTDAQKKLVGNYGDLKIAEEKAGNLPSPSDDIDSKGSTIPAKRAVYTMSLIRNKKASQSYLIGKKTKYKLVLKANGKAVAASKVKWKSGKKTIASISKNVVTFKKKGTVKITAVYQGKKHSFSLKVKKASFKLKKKKITLKKGKKYRIRYTALPKGKVTFRSMNKKIAFVTKKGIVKARRKGTVKIRVKCNGITTYQFVSVK